MDDVQWLRAAEQIKQAKSRYGELVDECPERGMAAALELAQLFTPDAECDFTGVSGRVLRGQADIAYHFGDFLPKARGWVWHSFHNPNIRIEGDRAWAYWTLFAMSTPRDDPGAQPTVSYGRYRDEHVRTADGWKQSRLVVHNETRDWTPLKDPSR